MGSERERSPSVPAIDEPGGPASGVRAAAERLRSDVSGLTTACEYVPPSPPPPRASHETVETNRVHVQPRVDRRAPTRPRLQRVNRRAFGSIFGARRRMYWALALAGVAAFIAVGWLVSHRYDPPRPGPALAVVRATPVRASAPTLDNDGPNGIRAFSVPDRSAGVPVDGRGRGTRAGSKPASQPVRSMAPAPGVSPVAASRPRAQRPSGGAERSLWLE